RKHYRGLMQFHRARPERDHRVTERQIARLEFFQVTQHLGLGVVRVEAGMSQKFRIADREFWNADWRLTKIVSKLANRCAAKDRHQQFDLAVRGRFIERNADRAQSKRAKITSRFFRVSDER